MEWVTLPSGLAASAREHEIVVRGRATRPGAAGGRGGRKRGNRGRILVPVLAFLNSNSLSEAVPSGE